MTDFVVSNENIYIASDGGVVVYDLKTKKVIEIITLKPLVDGYGRTIDAPIGSVDVLNGKVLIVSGGESGYKNVWIYKNHKLELLVDEKKQLMIKEARFVDENKVMFATMGADVILHDVGEQYAVYKTHIADYTIGDYQLSHDKKTMAIADESGRVQIVNVADCKVLQTLDSQNVDHLFHVAYAKDIVITAGQDMRVGVYAKNQKPYYIETSFLVYSVGLNPSGSLGIYVDGEESILQLFNPRTKEKIHRFIGHNRVVNQIKFVAENEFFSSDRGTEVYFWKF